MTINSLDKFSDYIVFVDESGDHGLVRIDSDYPVFVLVFCIFNKKQYVNDIVTRVSEFKIKFWGHCETVLHGHEIRKPKGEFTILFDKKVREIFLPELSSIIQDSQFTIIASVIDKLKLKNQYSSPVNPYQISMSFGLERVFRYLSSIDQGDKRTSLVIEKRGKKEDDELELVFRRICDGTNYLNRQFPFDLVMIDKKCNSTGLQLADLVARPIGLNHIRPNQTNRAFEIINNKIRKSPKGDINGWGLKVFP